VCAYEGADAEIYTYLKFQKMAASELRQGGRGWEEGAGAGKNDPMSYVRTVRTLVHDPTSAWRWVCEHVDFWGCAESSKVLEFSHLKDGIIIVAKRWSI